MHAQVTNLGCKACLAQPAAEVEATRIHSRQRARDIREAFFP